MDSNKEVYIPEEIIRNILKLLPVKSLIRFQCVCKAWKSLIKSPSFITNHLHHSSSQNPSLIIQCSGVPHGWCLQFLDCTLKLGEFQKLPLFNSFDYVSLVGSCNGLLLLEIENSSMGHSPLLLWNPATKEVGHVPIPGADHLDLYSCMTGFASIPIVNDYVIVRLFTKADSSMVLVEVFSLSRGSWKELNVGDLGLRICREVEPVTFGEAIFWIGLKRESECWGQVIISFDVVNEVFTVMPIPNKHSWWNDKLTIYENKLAMLSEVHGVHSSIQLWVLDEGYCASGKTWRWTERYSGFSFSNPTYPWTMWRSKIVSSNYGKNVLYSRDLLTNEAKRFVITCNCLHSLSKITGCYNYVESLVSVSKNCNEQS